MLSGWLQSYKLQRVEKKLKRAHAQQRNVRQELRDLDAAHRKGEIPPAEYDERKATLEARRSELTKTVSDLVAQEEALKRESDGNGPGGDGARAA